MYSKYSTQLLVTAVVLPVLATVAVALRFQARRLTAAGFAADDWVMLVALVAQLASMAMTIYWSVAGGAGASIQYLARHRDEYVTFAKILLAMPIMFALIISLVKTSILLLYTRIFTSKRFRATVYAFMLLTWVWFLTSILGTLLAYRPISDAWKFPGVEKFRYRFFLLAMGSINLALDLVTLVLPVFEVRKLHMSTKRKIGVIAIFWLGIFCVVASSVRLYYLSQMTRVNSSLISVLRVTMWSFIEPCASIIAACLPALASYWRGENSPLKTLSSKFRSVFTSSSPSSNRSSFLYTFSNKTQRRVSANIENEKRWSGSATKQTYHIANDGQSFSGSTLEAIDEDEERRMSQKERQREHTPSDALLSQA